MTDPSEGRVLPQLSLRATLVDEVDLPDDLLEGWTLLYFYPKDDTPGCTKQACAYRDEGAKFKELGVKLFGVSMDDIKSHEEFRDKFHLNFPLISDTEHKLADFLGVYGEREWNGKKFMGLSRDTFLLDPQARVVKAFRGVDPSSTVGTTFDAIKKLIES
jgi:peroxiredoxin Q/BCP